MGPRGAGGRAKYLVLVAKHHDGFCLFPTRETKYGVASSPWRNGQGDVVREVAAACRKHGLRFGVYLSPWDRHEPVYKDAAAYDTHYAHQVEELASRYGELTEFWLDGAGSEGHVYDFTRYIRTLRTYQPNTMIFADVGLLHMPISAGWAMKTAPPTRRTGTSSMLIRYCAGVRPKPTLRCATASGSGIPTPRTS